MSEFSTMLELFVDLDPMRAYISVVLAFFRLIFCRACHLCGIVPTLVAKGNYTHPYLGLALDMSPSAIAEDYESVPANLKGVFVNAIEKGGPADKASIRGSNLDQYYQRHSGDMAIMSQRLKISCHIYTNTRPLAIV